MNVCVGGRVLGCVCRCAACVVVCVCRRAACAAVQSLSKYVGRSVYLAVQSGCVTVCHCSCVSSGVCRYLCVLLFGCVAVCHCGCVAGCVSLYVVVCVTVCVCV